MIYLPLLIGFTVFIVICSIGKSIEHKWYGNDGEVSVGVSLLAIWISIAVFAITAYDIQDGRLDGQAVEVSK